MNTIFKVNDKPFFILGGQVHNSSAYSTDGLITAWKALSLLKANTAEIPVYWEQIEPREGDFDFNNLDSIILAARDRGLRLVLLWFGTWKNGSMQYVPLWIKADPERFPRVVTHAGNLIWVLSSHSKSNWEADRRAYCAILEHLKEFDGNHKTVIGIQIENEPGILGSVRDYSLEAEREYVNSVPDTLLRDLRKSVSGSIRDAWQMAGAVTSGSWDDVFGINAAEFFTAWSIARYIDRLAEAGKGIYPISMYVNAWLKENGWQLPGTSYPSGGPSTNVLDLWKWSTRHIDLICPDIYIENPDLFCSVCAAYQRPDNALFVPESGNSLANSLNIFDAIAKYQAIGYATFGVESILNSEGEPRPEALPLIESFQSISAVLPLIRRLWGSGQIYGITQREFVSEQRIDFGDYLGLVKFGTDSHWTDFHHNQTGSSQRGRGLIFTNGAREFFLVGIGYRLLLKKKGPDRFEFSKSHDYFDAPLTHYLSVEEGHFDENDGWVSDRVRNGDEITSGLWVAPDIGVVRALLAG